MAVLNIARMRHPTARPNVIVALEPSSPGRVRLVADLMETMLISPDDGLAAPQMGVPGRDLVVHVPVRATFDFAGGTVRGDPSGEGFAA
jgi:peptide deformylase